MTRFPFFRIVILLLLFSSCRQSVEKALPLSGLSCLYISLPEGEEALLNKDKNRKTGGNLCLTDALGDTVFNDTFKYIKGRGNDTWKLPKKPYTLRFRDTVSLLGMRASKRYYLLANAKDKSNLRNAVALDASRRFGLGGAEYAFVSLFINGTYKGVYQMTDASKDRQASGLSDNGGRLLYISGYEESADFVSWARVPVEIRYPEHLSKAQIDSVEAFYNAFEQAVMAADGINPSTGRHYSTMIDMPSFAVYYLLQEMFLNQDAGAGSVYLCLSSAPSPRLYAGALWDFDLSMGNPHCSFQCCVPQVIWAANGRKEKEGRSAGLLYYLCRHNDFNACVDSIYTQSFSAALRQSVKDTYERNKVLLADSVCAGEAMSLARFLQQRTDYMDWLYMSQDRKVRLDAVFNRGILDNKTVQIYVPYNTPVQLPQPQMTGLNFARWYYAGSGKRVEQNPVFTENTSIELRWSGVKETYLRLYRFYKGLSEKHVQD
jgi:hypothetical protein